MHHHADIAFFGGSLIMLIVNWADKLATHPSPLLQNLAYLSSIALGVVGIYLKLKKGKD